MKKEFKALQSDERRRFLKLTTGGSFTAAVMLGAGGLLA